MPAGSPTFLRRRSLRLRLLALSFAALTPSLIVVAFNQYEMRAARVAEVKDLALRSAQTANSEVNRIVSGVEAVLVTISRAPTTATGSVDACSAYLADVVSRLQSLTSLSLLSSDGVVRCRSLRNATGVDLSSKSEISDQAKAALKAKLPIFNTVDRRPRLKAVMAEIGPPAWS